MSFTFKTKEEFEEYLANLGIEYRFGCFSEKKPEVCHLLGEYLDKIKSDFAKAAKIFKSNCEDYNYPRSCYAYANYVAVGKGQVKQSFTTAYSYYIKGCEMDVAPACFYAGQLSMSGQGNEQNERDYVKGIEYMDKGCSLNHSNSCFYLSGLFIKGSPNKSIEKNMKEAFKYSEKACELGNPLACNNVSIMYKKGEGVEKNEKMSQKYKNKVEQLTSELEVTKINLDKLFTN